MVDLKSDAAMSLPTVQLTTDLQMYNTVFSIECLYLYAFLNVKMRWNYMYK